MNSHLAGTVYCPACGEEIVFRADITKIIFEDDELIINLLPVGNYNQSAYKQSHMCKPPGTDGKKFKEEL